MSFERLVTSLRFGFFNDGKTVVRLDMIESIEQLDTRHSVIAMKSGRTIHIDGSPEKAMNVFQGGDT